MKKITPLLLTLALLFVCGSVWAQVNCCRQSSNQDCSLVLVKPFLQENLQALETFLNNEPAFQNESMNAVVSLDKVRADREKQSTGGKIIKRERGRIQYYVSDKQFTAFRNLPEIAYRADRNALRHYVRAMDKSACGCN